MGICFSSHSSVEPKPSQAVPARWTTGITNFPASPSSPDTARTPGRDGSVSTPQSALRGLPVRDSLPSTAGANEGFAAPVVTDAATEERVAELRALVLGDAEVVRMLRSPKDNCFDCAMRVQCILNYHGIANATRGLFIWTGTSDELPENHFAILARSAGKVVVIDPTAGQFPGCEPMVATARNWCEQIAAASFGKAVLYRDYPNLAQARIGVDPLYRGSPLDFGGHALSAPAWYRRIVRAPEAFRDIRQRQLTQDNADLSRRLRLQATDLRRHPGMLASEVQRKLFPPDRHGLSRKV